MEARHQLYTLSVLVTVCACGDETLTGISVGAMRGSWTATEWVYVGTVDDRVVQDHLASPGSPTVRATFLGSDTVRFTYQWPDGFLAADMLAVVLPPDTLRLTSTVSTQIVYFRVRLTGDTMMWTGVDIIHFDFDGDGTDEDAYERFRWRRG